MVPDCSTDACDDDDDAVCNAWAVCGYATLSPNLTAFLRAVYGHKKITRLEFQKYIRVPQTADKFANERIRASTTQIDEFKTTKFCSDCFDPIQTSKSPHRYQFGLKCGM